MKILLLICLLLIPKMMTSQNAALNGSHVSGKDPETNIAEIKTYSTGNLTPVNNPEFDTEKMSVVNQTVSQNDQIFHNEFTSFTLLEQLEQLNRSTPMKIKHNATLERFIRVYLQNRRPYLNRLLGKSIYYFPIFEQYLDASDLPLELKYLAIVESALDQTAVSPSGAKGLWQFMYGTGLEYDLHIDSFVDERFDLLKSTKAACAYLKRLYQSFGDWDLALAAYNSGPGNVRKAIQRAGGNTNYWEIRQYLPRETSSYVPAFYAIMYLFSYADYHQLKPDKEGIEYYETDTIEIKGSLSFETIRSKTGIEPWLLKSLNPQYKQELIPEGKHRGLSLSLPTQFIPKFLASERTMYLSGLPHKVVPKNSGIIDIRPENSYLVMSGDNLKSIAVKHGISLEQLKKWNGLDTDFLIAGQRLVITDSLPPKGHLTNGNQTKELPRIASDEKTVSHLTYKVKNGDTLFKISRMFGNIPIEQLRALNALENVSYLKPGILLKIKKESESGNEMWLNKS